MSRFDPVFPISGRTKGNPSSAAYFRESDLLRQAGNSALAYRFQKCGRLVAWCESEGRGERHMPQSWERSA